MITYFIRKGCNWVKVTTDEATWRALPHVASLGGCGRIAGAIMALPMIVPVYKANKVGPVQPPLPTNSSIFDGATVPSIYWAAPTNVTSLPNYSNLGSINIPQDYYAPNKPTDVVEPSALLVLLLPLLLLFIIRKNRVN